jgi:hypothetical protein
MLMGYQSTRNRVNTGAVGPKRVRSSALSGGALTPDGAPYPPYDRGTS